MNGLAERDVPINSKIERADNRNADDEQGCADIRIDSCVQVMQQKSAVIGAKRGLRDNFGPAAGTIAEKAAAFDSFTAHCGKSGRF